jgi:hypothetical protein
MRHNAFKHRESWLHAAAEAMRTLFQAHAATIPANIRITCGFPSKRALALNRSTGQCWPAAASADGHFEIMVSPVLDDPLDVLGTLAHELVHAAVGLQAGHRGPFRKLALAIGFEGKMTATTAGAAFKQDAAPIIDDLGPYPHASLDASARKKQSTRLLKLECAGCGYTVRITRKWLDHPGPPACPECQVTMEVVTGEPREFTKEKPAGYDTDGLSLLGEDNQLYWRGWANSRVLSIA